MLNKTKLLTILSLAILSVGVAGCETMGGAGRDIEKAGEAVQDAAN